MNDKLLNVNEIAELLRVPKSWIYSRTSTDEMPHIHVGRYVRFEASEVLGWLKDQSGRDKHSVSLPFTIGRQRSLSPVSDDSKLAKQDT